MQQCMQTMRGPGLHATLTRLPLQKRGGRCLVCVGAGQRGGIVGHLYAAGTIQSRPLTPELQPHSHCLAVVETTYWGAFGSAPHVREVCTKCAFQRVNACNACVALCNVPLDAVQTGCAGVQCAVVYFPLPLGGGGVRHSGMVPGRPF